MRIKIARILDARTRYYEAGEGQPVMLVHGVGMSADTWLSSIPLLARDFHVCAPDILDNGFTEAGPYKGGPPQPYMVDHLLALADSLKWDRFSLVGSSLGSLLSTLLYLRAPQRVDKLVLVGPGAVLQDPADLAHVFDAAAKNGRSAIENPTYDACKARMGRAVFDASCVPDTLLTMQMLLYALPEAMEKFDRRMEGLKSEESLRDYTIYDRLGSVKVPTLVLMGREDPRGDYAKAQAGARLIPKSEIVTYEQCGHWPQVEHPERFCRDVSAFLKSQHASA
jgi:2-hydroxy-6-oxonona-2,4-dienedioate hydrolase